MEKSERARRLADAQVAKTLARNLQRLRQFQAAVEYLNDDHELYMSGCRWRLDVGKLVTALKEPCSCEWRATGIDRSECEFHKQERWHDL